MRCFEKQVKNVNMITTKFLMSMPSCFPTNDSNQGVTITL